jgi:hypothetical protein
MVLLPKAQPRYLFSVAQSVFQWGHASVLPKLLREGALITKSKVARDLGN